ncbi:hypothetical protein A6A04_19365 [Paramagnetospirillum marisnigri]|uniref:DUF1800 domain-containing protein n=1 Tax=Paramagnetospirillum marisnigri TaxID=1285242 RepID=A0A178MLF5_9PROT|nr:DUF1800 domain-containing protein [Paramagnetospirillum marisnigri]OAN49506.1 hypothetical protein A6A04_19365 [Paramagnetospirillum marisnigri]
MTRDTAHFALARFGMGAAPGEASAIAPDPRGWVLEQLARPASPAELIDLPDHARILRRMAELKRERAEGNGKGELRQLYVSEAGARTRAALTSPTPLIERLVRFWSNHFTVSAARAQVAPIAGAFEREAIRPHVLGRFRDMLRAVVRHPAMLAYLDNAQSIGPNSPAGQKRGKGLNENLARELLELHSLGVDGGYTQADVEALARVLTGWTIDPALGSFRYVPRQHEPGPKQVLGLLLDGGEEEAEQALLMLSRHPATARFIAAKLARHFSADDPPVALVDALAKAYRDSDGDLLVMTRALVSHDAAWAMPQAKIRSPDDLVIATARLLGPDRLKPEESDRRLVQTLALLGQSPWSAPSPAGWPDRGEAWIGPDALMRRLEWAKTQADRWGRGLGGGVLDEAIVGGAATRQAVAGTKGAEALFLVLASREFQRR